MAKRTPAAGRQSIAEQREEQVLRLRISGVTFRAIAQQLDMSVGGAKGVYDRAIGKVREQTKENARKLYSIQLDELTRHMATIMNGYYPVLDRQGQPIMVEHNGRMVELTDPGPTIKSAEMILKIQESGRKMFGLDEAQKFEHTGPDGEPIPIEVRVAAMNERANEILARRQRSDADIIELPPPSGNGHAE